MPWKGVEEGRGEESSVQALRVVLIGHIGYGL
jgi:hypothetical protein